MIKGTWSRIPSRHGIWLRTFGFPKLRISTKAYVAAGGTTGILALLAFIFISVLGGQKAFLNDIDNVHFPRTSTLTNYSLELSQLHSRLNDGLIELLVTTNSGPNQEALIEQSRKRLNPIVSRMQYMAATVSTLDLAGSENSSHGSENSYRDSLKRSMNSYVDNAVHAVELAATDLVTARQHMTKANENYLELNAIVASIVDKSRLQIGDTVSEAYETIAYSTLIFTIILVVATTFIALFGWAISRALVLDLKGISEDMTVLAAGDTSLTGLPKNRTGEINQMIGALRIFRKNALEFRRVNQELQDRERATREAKEIAEQEKQDAVEQMRIAQEEKAQRELELVHAQKLESLGTLAGGVAHEINTPIQFIGNNLDFLQESFAEILPILEECRQLTGATDPLPPVITALMEAIDCADPEFLIAEIPESISQSQRGAGHISEIVLAIKEFSHPGTKDKTPIDINHAILNTATVARNQWKYIADLETKLDETLPDVWCLPGELNQVILNLIVNAAHAIEASGEGEKGIITITTRRDGQSAEIEVADTGCGIPEENLKKIFEPFFTTKEPGKGTGQGLSIIHAIITKKHGGDLSVRSTVGSGTSFTVRLPISNESSEVAAA